MTAPRQYHPGQIAMATRRTAQGQLLLLPDDGMYDIAAYCTALGLRASGAEIYAGYWGPNQTHNVIGDPFGLRDRFYCRTHGNATLARNRQLGEFPDSVWFGERRGALWDAQRTNDLKLLDEHVVLEKMLYTWLNPVQDGLVDHPDEYDGFMVRPEDLEGSVRARRPEWYFSAACPEELVFVPRLPPMLRHLPVARAIDLLKALVDSGARAIRERRAREGKSTIGRKRLRDQRPWDYPYVARPTPGPGRPSKASREAPYADFDHVSIEVERSGVQVAIDLPMPPQCPILPPEEEPAGRNPYRLRSVQTAGVQKKQKLKQRFPREFPEQFNPPRFYASDIGVMNAAYRSFNTAIKRHARCMERFREGDRDVVFPAGTVKMRHVCGVTCSTEIPSAQMPRPPTLRATP